MFLEWTAELSCLPSRNTGRENVAEATPDHCTDEELLLRFNQGEIEAFELLVRRYERELYGYLRRYLGDANLAEDVFQTTFLQIYLKSKQYQEGRRVRPWLYTIATNQAIDTLRRVGRHQAVSLDEQREQSGEGDAPGLTDLLESWTPRSAMVRAAIASASVDELPEHLRQVLLLAYYQGLKYREVADIVGIPVGTVKSRLHAALMKLNEAWNRSTTHREL